MRRVLQTPLLVTVLFCMSSCSLPSATSTSDMSGSASPNPTQVRKLEDWKIRAGLYDAHHAPLALHYVGDAAIDAHQYSGQCRAALQELKPYSRGLLKAPTPQLRRDALRVHRAGLAYLRACIRGRAVAWHHGDASWKVSTTQVNIDYARAMGANPTDSDAPKVFN